MNTTHSFYCFVLVLAVFCMTAVVVPCHAADDPFGPKSRELTEDDLNKGYDKAFKIDMKHYTTPQTPDPKKNLGVDQDRPLGSEGNIKSDDQMSNQNSYTE